MKNKKLLKTLAAVTMSGVTAFGAFGLVACGGGHTHHWSDWESISATQHQRECDAEGHEGERTETGPHGTANSENKCPDCGYQFAAPHDHVWATTYTNTNVNKHYYDCTASGHTGAYKDEAAHEDADLDGDCDECGYTYTIPEGFNTLLNKSGTTKIVASTFVKTGETLAKFSSWGTAGLYQDEVTETNYVDILNGKATLVTPNANPATNLYVDFGGAKGVIEGYFEMSDFANGLTGYTPVQFQGMAEESSTEIFGLRANTTWQYRLDGGSNTNATNSVDMEGSKIYFSYNSANNKITVKANDQVLVEDLQLSTALTGIKFTSGSSNNKTYSLDNLVVVYTPITLDAYKDAVNANATAAKGKIHADITVDDTSAKATFDAAITAADTNQACDEAYTAYYTALLTSYTTAVTTKIDADYPSTSYTKEQNQSAYNAAKTTLTGALTDATTIEQVTTAYTTAKTSLSALKDDDYYNLPTFAITVNDGTDDVGTITGLRSGDKVTKAQLDAKVTVSGTQVIKGYTVGGSAVVFGEDGYAVTGAVTFVAVFETADSDKGTYTYTLSGNKTDGYTLNAEKTEGSLGNPATILTKEPETAKDSTDFKFGTDTDTLTFKLNVTAGQTVSIKISGKGSSDKANGLNATSSGVDATVTKGTEAMVSQTGKVDFSDVELVYTVSAAGEFTITLTRVKGAGIKVGTVVITVADPA